MYSAIGAPAGTARSTRRRAPTTVIRHRSSSTLTSSHHTRQNRQERSVGPGLDVRPFAIRVVVPDDAHRAGDLTEDAVRAEQPLGRDVPLALESLVVVGGLALRPRVRQRGELALQIFQILCAGAG